MMNPTSSIGTGNGISSEQTSHHLSLTSSQQPPPFTTTLQQQQNLALQWLQQQQQEQQQQNTLKQAIVAAAVAQQQEQQSMLRPSVGNTVSLPITSSTSDVRNRQLLEMELCRQVLLQQQQLAQTRESLSIDHTKTILQDRLGHLLTANAAAAGNQENNSAVSAPRGGGTGTLSPAELDRLLEAETLLQRNRLQDAIRMLQMQGVLQEDHSVSRIVNNSNSHDNNAFATSALLLSNGPITPNTIGQATLTNNTLSQLLQPGILNMGQVVPKRPRMNDSIDEQLHIMTNHSKRKSDSTQSCSTKETLQKKVKSEVTRADKLSAFPLPSINRTRGFQISLRSFQDVWDELETTPLQQEIFIRRLYKYDCKLVD